MNKKVKSLLFVVSMCCFFVTSCDWSTDIEEKPIDILSTLLYSTQNNLLSLTYKEPAVYGGVFTQQISGIDGFIANVEHYNLEPSHFDENWQLLYLGVFSNLNSITSFATKYGYDKYGAIAKLLTAQALGVATSLWGDIPYSDSFASDELVKEPAYDNQEDIFQLIFELIDQGVEEMNQYGEQHYPNDDDIFFSGNSSEWIRYGKFLKIKFMLYISNVNGYDGLANELSIDIFQEPGDAFSVDFEELGRNNPRGQYLMTHKETLRASSFFLSILEANNDPRLPVFFTATDTGYVGNTPGDNNTGASTLSNDMMSSTSDLNLATYTEWMFIKAECLYRTGDVLGAKQAFCNAVKSSLIDFGVYSQEWLDGYIESVDFSLETILIAKYTAMYLTPEVWFDWRRTGVPLLQAVDNKEVPRRFLYPQSEYFYNAANVPSNITLSSRMWIDPE